MNKRRRSMLMGAISSGGGNTPSILPGEVFGLNVQPLDVVFADANEQLHIIHGEENWSQDLTPIGIVIVPGSHNRYGNTSLHGILGPRQLTSVPKDAFAGEGYDSLDTPLTNYQYVYESNEEIYITLDEPSLLNEIRFPYDSSGNLITNLTGAISDFSGEENTAVYYSVSITAYPAINRALEFSTIGTSAGDWYMPAAGELAYLAAYWFVASSIKDSLKNLYNVTFDIGYVDDEAGLDIPRISSTEHDDSNMFLMRITSKNGSPGKILKTVSKAQKETMLREATFMKLLK